jgi:Protein of unknown function (DUF2587)
MPSSDPVADGLGGVEVGHTPSVEPDEVLPAVAPAPGSAPPEAERADQDAQGAREPDRESIEQPAKVMRIGSMVKQLLDEVRQAPLDEAGRIRLREIYEQSVAELSTGLSPDLVEELDRMRLPFVAEAPSEAELRIAQAQLVGWLEGLFHGIQAMLVAQQMAARAQLEEMRQRGLPAGAGPGAGSEDGVRGRPSPTGYL